ncbi:hypothetical protein GUITHDRAFT_112890 [Guillardia theta CCMP2712]|uniref:Uncharacterized protein n=1 Tax=Guillardia theta (strain CCMP2712) TaxID=905079 RepID=L1IZ24_GUITC|nr:hypothetical protein GUITHDRAFT_112890 [Guillardia theta CCMP2712]EKX41154.1 hypothetical protein GUITHDRAFT_112890 [Guillardia theta CCMP2712]|eukprot:XP_005828134.1 hypothetical protein GUITHDRAFT_112890 [Guillardia theta CCMP2712]
MGNLGIKEGLWGALVKKGGTADTADTAQDGREGMDDGDLLVVVDSEPSTNASSVWNSMQHCHERCSLVVSLEYDGEGLVFDELSLRILHLLSNSRKRCFWLMSASSPSSFLPPHLDIACLSTKATRSAPPDVEVVFEDVHAQLRRLVKSFNPKFYQDNVFTQGVIKSAICKQFGNLCPSPRGLALFQHSDSSLLGRSLSLPERTAAAKLRRLIQDLQFPIFCYTNPKLAGHGAQFHAMMEAFSYAIATNRTMVLDDECDWSMKVADNEGFGRFWWNSILIGELLRPNNRVEEAIAQEIEKFKDKGSTLRICIHHRSGHKVIEIPPRPVQAYADELVSVLLRALGMRVAVSDESHPRPNFRISIPKAVSMKLLDAEQENMLSLVSLFTMARSCDVFLGPTRLVMELAVSARAAVIPHASLDVASSFY